MSIAINKNTSASNVVLLHYATAAILFFFITILLLISCESFTGHYFQPKVLAITHLATLGWISMIIFGALYQLVPVIVDSELYSTKLSVITYICFVIGTLLLVYSFWYIAIGLTIQTAASVIGLGATLFVCNIFFTARKATAGNIEINFILSAAFWLWLTVLIGTLLAFNLTYSFLPKEHLYYLKIHAHVGLIGWFMMLIIGVSSKLIPMFLLSGILDNKKLQVAFYLLNTGLVGFLIDSIFLGDMSRSPIYLIILLVGIAFYILFLAKAYKSRVRKKLDIGLKHTFIAVVFISIPIVLMILLNTSTITDPNIRLHLSIAFGFSVLFGFISLLILGQTFKTLPFIVWLKKYGKISSKVRTPLPKDLYSEKLAKLQLVLFIVGYLIMVAGILLAQVPVMQFGAFALVIAAILYNMNVFKLVFHKTTILENKIIANGTV